MRKFVLFLSLMAFFATGVVLGQNSNVKESQKIAIDKAHMAAETAVVDASTFPAPLAGERENSLQIGFGTTYGSWPAYYGPWGNYWENVHTQTLYLASELGSPMLITRLGWEFERLGTAALQNVEVRILETSDASLTDGAFYDVTGSTLVFSSASYTPATVLGWNVLDIDDYVYTGTNNLIIDIVWGDNGSYEGTYYRTFKESAPATRSLIGYADSETPPGYDNSSTEYDNLMVYWEPLTAPGTIQGFVTTTDGTAIQGALVQIENVSGVTTDATGYYQIIDLMENTYDVYCTKDGYSPETQSVYVAPGSSNDVDFVLGQPNLTISPLLLENTLNPGEWFTDYIGMLNTGDGAAYWNASINFIDGDGWLSLSDAEGVVAAGGGTFNLGVNFDAQGLTAGTVLNAEVIVDFLPTAQVVIPVTMTVAGDGLVAVENFKAVVADPVTGQTMLTWDFNPDVTFQYFEIRRDGAVLGITNDLNYFDFLPDYGVYTYSVAAVYDEGTSTAQFDDVEWFIPTACWAPADPEEDVMINQTEDTWMTVENCGQGSMSWSIAGPGAYQVALIDSYGDGWNGGSLDVMVNGNVVLSGITLANGSGPEFFSFMVEDGDEITTTYHAGSWSSENSYDIYNDLGEVVYSAPNDDIPAGVLFASVTNYAFSFITNITPMTGVLEEGQSVDVRFTYDATNYAVGTYTQDIHLKTNEQAPDNDHLITHTMNVYTPGSINGLVADCNTGVGLANVTVMADNGITRFYGETDQFGNYEMFVDAATYDVTFTLLGYQTTVENAVVVTEGNATTVDATLCEEAYPVSGVFADPNEADTQALITWNLPAGPYAIIYDDNSAEEYAAWIQPGGAVAVKFTPAGYPAIVTGGSVYVGDGYFPEGGNWLGTQMSVGVIDDDGTNGMPGTVLDSIVVDVDQFGWITFNNAFYSMFMEGDFYIAMWQLGVAPDAAPIGIDTDFPTVYRSYAKQAGGSWFTSPYQDYMIRAEVSGVTSSVVANNAPAMKINPPKAIGMGEIFIATNKPSGTPGYVKNGRIESEANATRDLNKYNVIRLSGFDPDAGETPIDATIQTGIGSSTTTEKVDTQLGPQDAGFYAYAVEAQYDSGDKSPWAYSNVFAHLLDNVVTITATQCDGGEPSDVEVTLVGHNYPYDVLFGVSGTDGVITFDSVIDGVYDINVFKVAYQNLFFANVPIYNDYNLAVVLQENNFPPRNLVVDPLTSVATWDEALIEQIQLEDFEGSTFPPQGWTKVSNDPGSVAEWNRWNEYNGDWVIPPQFEDGTSSWFAAAISDAESVHDGSNDLLITPMLDLRESETFALYFDSYFDGAYGQLARIEYSTDGGATWELLQEMTPAAAWTPMMVDLSPLSGIPAGNGQIWFAFHSDDQNEFFSGWAIDNVSIHNGSAPILGYYVYLDDGFVAQTAPEIRTYTYGDLVYGTEYTAAVRALYSCGLSDAIYYTWTSTYLYPPRELGDEYVYNTNEVPLMWLPPVYGDGVPSLAPATDFVKSDAPASIGAAPANGVALTDTETVNQDVIDGMRDAVNVYGVSNDVPAYSWFSSDVPGVVNTIAPYTQGNFTNASEFKAGSSEIMYFIDNAGVVEEVDVVNATVTTLGTISVQPNGMALDYADGTYYLIDSDNLYTLDIDNLTTTLVGAMGTGGLHIGLTFDGDGNLYSYDLQDDNFFAIDKTTGAATVIGSIGFDANYGQGLGYDGVNDMVVMSAFNSGSFQAEYRSVDVTTGASALIGAIGISGTTQFGSIAMPATINGSPEGVPDGLISFNVYRNGEFLANVPYEGQLSDEYVTYVDNMVDPGTYLYDVSAVYDLSIFGFVGETGESMWEGTDTVEVVWGNELPFFEGWDQGTFDFQNWKTFGENWSINSQVGNNEPAAEFSWDPLQELDYSVALETAPLKADMLTEGSIYVDFDLKLNDRNSTGDEMLNVEVRNANGDWSEVASFANNGSFDWTANHIELNGAMGNVFQVRFNAVGQNSFDVISWYVDNVHVYRMCAAPQDLTGEYQWNAIDDLGAEVCWNAPDIPMPIAEWIGWDSGENFSGIGLQDPGPWTAAIRWDAGMLADYDGTYITKVRFVPQDDGFNSFNIKIWTGANASTLIAEQMAVNPVVGMFNEVVLDTPVLLDASQEIWIGYTVDQNAAGVFPAGTDAGPAVAGYGDKVSLDGSAWDNISDFGLDYNWNIEAFVEEMTTAQPVPVALVEEEYHSESTLVRGEMKDVPVVADNSASRAFTGFILYRQEAGAAEYTELTQVPYVDGQTAYCYFDADVAIQTGYNYKVTSTWESDTDACESNPAMAKINTDEDFVYVFITGIDNPEGELTNLYPNPATDQVNIASSVVINKVTVVNYVGQVVYTNEVNDVNSLTLNTASYDNGVYVVKLDTENGVITKRVTIAK